MKICLKELRETQINLRIIKAKNYEVDLDTKVLSECSELVAIFTSSIATAKQKMK